MMQIICSGFGGQGILTLGLILAEIANDLDKHIVWIPSYGGEMRGGTANCTLTISDEPIINPYIEEVDLLVALNKPALERFSPRVRPGGCIIVNSSIVKQYEKVKGVKYIELPATEIAMAEQNERGIGLVFVAASMAYLKFASKEEGAAGVEAYFAKKHIKNPKNKPVYLAGYEAALKSLGA